MRKRLPLFILSALSMTFILTACDLIQTVPVIDTQTSEIPVTSPTTNTGAVVVTPSPSSQAYTAGAFQNYTKLAFEEAVRDGKTVMLNFHADWCRECIENEPHVKAAFSSMNDPQVVGFKVAYDNTTKGWSEDIVDLKKRLNINYQMTFVIIKDGEETKRFTGSVDTAKVIALVQ